MKVRPYLSIVIPAFDEARRIERSLQEIVQYLEQRPFPSEVIVVDDGSRDATAAIVRAFADTWSSEHVCVRLLRNERNFGKGYSVRRGFLHARGEIVLFTDADLSTPIAEAERLLRIIETEGADVAFGSRGLDQRFILKPQSLLRRWAGRIFNLLMRALTGLPFKDTQCGFKAYRRESMLPIFRSQRIFGFGFDVEILYLARKRGLRLRETPVLWANAEGTKVRLGRDAWRTAFDLLRIRMNDWRGRYASLEAERGMTRKGSETLPPSTPSVDGAS
ncbi:MAG: glycosyltransferase family 2 protein [Blastocatellia bacterium]|nr:glycosyltransferase family 2 protein [Blastocatellia bacterium]MDW8256250.1 glycosyltransferase family 2 protein [Acidobacteriota bacterium]